MGDHVIGGRPLNDQVWQELVKTVVMELDTAPAGVPEYPLGAPEKLPSNLGEWRGYSSKAMHDYYEPQRIHVEEERARERELVSQSLFDDTLDVWKL
jgi:hypothetical protein